MLKLAHGKALATVDVLSESEWELVCFCIVFSIGMKITTLFAEECDNWRLSVVHFIARHTYLSVNRLCNLHWLELNENWQDKGTKTKRSRCRVLDSAAAVRQQFHCYFVIVEKRCRRNVVQLVFGGPVLLRLGGRTCLFRVSWAPSKPTPALIIHPTGWDWRNPLGFMTSFSIRCTGKSSEWLQHLTLTVSRPVNTYQTCQRFKTLCRHLLSWTVVCYCSCLILMHHSPNTDCKIQICVDFFSRWLQLKNIEIFQHTYL